MLTFVTTKEAAVENIHRYNAVLAEASKLPPDIRKDMLGTYTRARAWYAVRHGQGFLFGPSKFIGYADITPAAYHEQRKTNLDGRMTESVLAAWATEVGVEHPAFIAFREFCARANTKPNTLARVSVIEVEEATQGDREAKLVELVCEIVPLLSERHRDALRRRIAAMA
ncbi:hypothetical protein ACFOD4_04620 [Pseudoroseomonas globiformis]|uniref:Uncharacterized protein n=1 Tax=Teichococcus globiformis TaxID=2307229 RepID=A0ABV7FY38_9PROT